MRYLGPDLLWALRCSSPKRALELVDRINHGGDGCILPMEGHADASLAVNYDSLIGDVVSVSVKTDDASPSVFREEAIGRGLHLRAAMTEDLLWKVRKQPMSEFVILAQEVDDVATYQAGESFLELGRVEYRRALEQLKDAIRDGWPGWVERGVMML